MAKCLRCGAGNEWIQGKVKREIQEKDLSSVNEVYDFASKIAKTMKEISSSHVYFIFQTAFDKKNIMDWNEVIKKLDNIITLCKINKNY